MTSEELYQEIQFRTDMARFGYVDPWKNRSIISTFEGLFEADPECLTKARILNHVFSVYGVEGVEMGTIVAVTDILFDHFHNLKPLP